MNDDPAEPQGGLAPRGAPEVAVSGRLRRIFDLAAGPGTPEELGRQREIVAAMVDAAAARGGPVIDEIGLRRKRRGTKLATRAAIVAAGVLVGASTAAAAGVFPDGAQSAISRATAHVGWNLPNPDSTRSTVTTTAMPTNGGPDGNAGPVGADGPGSIDDPNATSATTASASATSSPLSGATTTVVVTTT
ncbi:MAG: hypothetical protein ABIR68_19540, partial [Ilumatobacteraceae bacterium]